MYFRYFDCALLISILNLPRLFFRDENPTDNTDKQTNSIRIRDNVILGFSKRLFILIVGSSAFDLVAICIRQSEIMLKFQLLIEALTFACSII